MSNHSIEKYIIPKKIKISKKLSIGFIGLGKMGAAMAGHLAIVGHSVSVFNRSSKKEVDWLEAFKDFSIKKSEKF